jgi:uncharacterized RDD family membrane protein YckC
MSVRAERVVSAAASKNEEIVVEFDPKSLKAPFALRCGALLIDYIIIVIVPIISLLIGRFLGDDGSKLLNSELSNAGWLIATLLALSNFIIFPMFSSQTIGKMLTGLRIVKTDGKTATLGNLAMRHLVGYPLTILSLGLGFLLSIFSSKGRALHDYISGTIVVYGLPRPKEIEN